MNKGGNETMADLFGETLRELVEQSPDVVVLDGDSADSTRCDLVAESRPDRFFQMGIAQQNMVGVAAGLATLGFIPWVTTHAGFLASRVLDQTRLVVAQPRLNVKFAAHCSGIAGRIGGGTQPAIGDLAILRTMPNLTIIAPGCVIEMQQAIRAATASDGPVYLRLACDQAPNLFNEDYRFEIGKAVTVRQGSDVSIISTGAQTACAQRAAVILDTVGVSSHILHVPTIKPLDRDAVVETALRTRAVVTAEDDALPGGLGSAVAEVLGEDCPVRMRRIGLGDLYGESGPADQLLERHGLPPGHIANAARELLQLRSSDSLKNS